VRRTARDDAPGGGALLRGVFVTGTDTSVGKTVVSAALVSRYRQIDSLRYWKPIQTGIDRDDDTAEVCRLTACGRERVLDAGIRLPRPVSPHLAARLNGTSIDLGALVEIARAQSAAERWVVEGAGGVLVPVNSSDLMVDVIVGLTLPALVVARSGLGTINHTLLTLEGLRSRSVVVAGVVMVGPPDADNRRAIEDYGRVRVLGELPWLDPLAPEPLGHWAERSLDPAGHLMEFLR
jgi:dethiobiotin synthase